MIVKMQRSLATTHVKPTVLVYDRDRTFTQEFEITPEIALVFGSLYKVYAEADIRNGQLHLTKQLPLQAW